MPTLFVIEPGSRIEKEYQRILVTLEDEILFRVPIQQISHVVLIGQVGVTTPALHALLEAEIPLSLITRTGKLLGRLSPPTPPNLALRRKQYAQNDNTLFCLQLARALVINKIQNQYTLDLRLTRCRPHLAAGHQLAALQASIQQAAQAESMDVLLGVEGNAARIHFQLYKQAFAPQWCFLKRTRRPPTDPINAVLSLGYSLLTQACFTALETVQLDPYLGYLHTEQYGRPALALDLVEQFRAPIVDSLALWLFNRHILQEEQFEHDPQTGGIVLTNAGLKIFFHQYSHRLESEIAYRTIKRNISYRKLLEYQARQLARYIQGEIKQYKPFRAR